MHTSCLRLSTREATLLTCWHVAAAGALAHSAISLRGATLQAPTEVVVNLRGLAWLTGGHSPVQHLGKLDLHNRSMLLAACA